MKFCNNLDYKTEAEVSAAYPSAAKIVCVDGGWMMFNTLDAYEVWMNQI